MSLNEDEFIEKYIEYVLEMDKNIEKGNSRLNNKYVKKANRLNKQYKNEDYYINALNRLMNSNNLSVASNAAADSLRK